MKEFKKALIEIINIEEDYILTASGDVTPGKSNDLQVGKDEIPAGWGWTW